MSDRGPHGNTNNEEEGGQSIWRTVLNAVMMYMAMQFLIKQFGIGKQSQQAAEIVHPSSDESSATEGTYQYALIPELAYPMWPLETPMDISIYLHESIILPPLQTLEGSKIFDEKHYKLGDKNDKRLASVQVPFSNRVKSNGTLFAHILVAQSGGVIDPSDAAYDPAKAFRQVKLLTRYMPMKKTVKTKKLIGGSVESENNKEQEEEIQTKDAHGNPIIIAYWHSNLTIDVVHDPQVLQYKSLPPPVRQHVRLEATGKRDATGQNGWYYPVLFANDFWLLREHMMPINKNVDSLPLHIELKPRSWWTFQILASIDESFKQQNKQPGLGGAGATGAELEEFKRVLLETNPYLLGTTVVVSILHSVFEMLAFKNDISHWKKKKDNVGISVRTIIANVFMQTVIFLYLIDNSENTSWMILAGQGFGILVEAWKITKAVDVKLRQNTPGAILPYKLTFEDKHKLSQLEKETKEYDEIAFKYLYMAAIPLLLAYAVYSLLYETHKSWYSFIITTLVGSVYAYGFLMMVPSLYINYRLKSVAHMPRKAMMYKFLNTFIDDLFAFTIKMPLLHRLATLRDDVIFFVYLYQSYVYKVDMKRVNEFGQGGEDSEEDKEKKDKQEGKHVKTLTGKDDTSIAETKVVKASSSAAGGTAAVKLRK